MRNDFFEIVAFTTNIPLVCAHDYVKMLCWKSKRSYAMIIYVSSFFIYFLFVFTHWTLFSKTQCAAVMIQLGLIMAQPQMCILAFCNEHWYGASSIEILSPPIIRGAICGWLSCDFRFFASIPAGNKKGFRCHFIDAVCVESKNLFYLQLEWIKTMHKSA